MAEKKSGLSFKQILAGAGSAVTAAYIGTKLGVSGTIIGAAVGSVTGTVATHLYANSLTQGKEALRKAQDVALLSALTKGKAAVTSVNDDPLTSEYEATGVTSEGTVTSTDVINALIDQDLQELEASIRKPWYKNGNLPQIALSSGIAMVTAVGILYAFGSFLDDEDKTQRGGVSINSITVETHEPAPEPTIIYMPSPSLPPTPTPTATATPTDTPPTSPPEDLGTVPRLTTPPTPTKPAGEPTRPPATPTQPVPPPPTVPVPIPTPSNESPISANPPTPAASEDPPIPYGIAPEEQTQIMSNDIK